MKLYIFLLIFCLLSASMPVKAHLAHHPLKCTGALALKKIRALPEVKAFMRYAKKSEPIVMIAGGPDSTRKYYWIKSGICNFGMFRTSDDFLVDPKTSEIYFYDIALEDEPGDKIATLKQWRRWRSDPRFWKPHIFKRGKIVALTK